MTLENWVKNSWLEKRASDREEIGRLLTLADGRLEDYKRAVAGKLSADVQLGLAYDAIRISATAALRAAGYRVVRGGSEHYRTIEALEFSIDPQKKLIPTLDKLRKKRNIGWYDDFDQELLLRNEYLAAENRILRSQIKGRLLLSDGEKATLAEIAHRLGRMALVAPGRSPANSSAWVRA